MKNNDYDFIIGNDSTKIFNPSDHLIHGIIPTGIKVSSIKKVSKLKNDFNTTYNDLTMIKMIVIRLSMILTLC